MKAADKRRRNSNSAAEAMEVTMDAPVREAKGQELAILRLLGNPPTSSGQFASYLDMVSRSFAPLGQLDGMNLSIGLRAIGVACENIHDASLFRLVARIIINENGLNPDVHVPNIESPLKVAIRHLNVEAVRFLVRLCVHKKNEDMKTAECVRGINEAIALAGQLISNERSGPRSHRAIEIMKAIVSLCENIDPVAMKNESQPIVHDLCFCAHESESGDLFETIELLLKKGLSPKTPDGQTGRTALHHAAEKNHWRTAIHLIRFGADIEATDQDGKTPFHYAEQSGFVSDEMRAIFRSAKMNNIISKKSLAKV
jgi:hypothetical protein